MEVRAVLSEQLLAAWDASPESHAALAAEQRLAAWDPPHWVHGQVHGAARP